MAPRIVVDLLFYTGTRGGTETYARQIIRRLPEAMPDATFIALTGRAGAPRVADFFPGEVRTIRTVGADRVSWAAAAVLQVDRAARRENADVVWCPANFGPIHRGVPRVMTIHDVIYHEVAGGLAARVSRSITSQLMARAALTADAVITGSQAAARQIRQHIDVPATDITVIPHGASGGPVPDDPWAELATLGIRRDRPIVLSTGNRLPHKNFEGLLRAVAWLPEGNRPLLVVPGSHGKDPLGPLVDHLGLDDDVVLPGWVTAPQLEALYRVAALYVCPSLVEGFGLPVIDAMRRGCLVLANDVPVLREVGGESALYADATSASLLGAALIDALESPADPARIEAGRRWAAGFTWERAAAATARVLRETLATQKTAP